MEKQRIMKCGKDKVVTKASGEPMTYDFTGENYTPYNWKVTVTDGKSGEVNVGTGTTRTYCKTTKCPGPFTKQVDCTGCGRCTFC